KKVFSVNASFAASSVTQVLSSSHRYEDMECDDVTFAPQTVIWVMWFNQNVLLPMPISGTCSTAPPPPPALNLGQSSNGPVTVGSNLAFAVTVSDTGASGQTGVWLTDTPPAGTTLVSSVPSQGTCAGSAPVSCSLGSIAAGGTATVTVTVSTATPGQATNAATAQSNTVGPVSNSYSTTIDPAAGTTDVTVGDGGFSPTTVTSPQGGVVAFLFQGTVDHGAADNTGMGLFDSGLMTPGSSFDYSYSAAGTYSVVDSATGHLATVKVPVIAPATGSVGAPLTITYASAALPPGFNADIQVRVPGTTKWVAVASDQAGTSVQYTPKGSGVYKFRSRFQLGTVHASKFSPAISIKVS
ncbi:MAG TPA: hypothetical protein VMU66_09775, partial [Gaiellales bacterium]|nr:hypothetical protein [Gaiellales bacterium]